MPLPKCLPRLAGCLLALALLAACGGPAAASSAPPASAAASIPPEEDMDIPYSSRTVYAGSYDGLPGEAVFAECVTTPAGLEAFSAARAGELWPESLEALAGYDDTFFAEQALVLAAIDTGSGSDRYTVTGVQAAEGALTVTIALVPAADDMMGTSDMARFLFLVEVPARYGGLPVQVVLA